MNRITLVVVIGLMISCTDKRAQNLDLEGHRGARGLVPENTIPGFIKAIDLGVNTIEMDILVTKDLKLIVSHDPYISAEICLDPNGDTLSEDSQHEYLIYQMSYEEVSRFDCGSKPNPQFPEQVNRPLSKPLLEQVIDSVEAYLKARKLPSVAYNIELKSWEKYDTILHPVPEVFSDMVYELINQKLDWDRVTIQSFDFRILQYFHKTYPDVALSLLIENKLTYQENLDSLGFFPDVYSVDYKLLNPGTIDALHALGIKVIPWTINETDEMKKFVGWGVDGIITDYPNRYPGK